MSFAKNAFYSATRLVPLPILQNNQLLLPYHHLVSDKDVPHIKHLYPFKGIKAFEKDLDYLGKHFTPVTLQQVINAIKNGQTLPQRAFLLTFDDGLREVTENIAPLLYKKGIPAAFFLNNAFIDNKTLFYKFKISLITEALQTQTFSPATLTTVTHILEKNALNDVKGIKYNNRGIADEIGETLGLSFDNYLNTAKPFMTTEEMKQLVAQGFALGGHSIDHPYYEYLTIEEQLHQTRTSVNYVKEHFNLDYSAFAFPHTDAGVSRSFFDTALKEIDVIFGTANHKRDISPRILHRFNCERPGIAIDESVKGILLYNKIQQLRNKNFIYRK
jgi:hypothetical protein